MGVERLGGREGVLGDREEWGWAVSEWGVMEKDGEEGNRMGSDMMGRYAEKWDGWDGNRKIWAGMGRNGRGGSDKAI